jgi:hypothetical protein
MNPISFFRNLLEDNVCKPEMLTPPILDVKKHIYTGGTFLDDKKRELLMVNEEGQYMAQFPNHDADWAWVDLDSFVPAYEFSDCVYGEIKGSVVKLFWAEINPDV